MRLETGTILAVNGKRVTVEKFLAEGGLAHVYLVRLERGDVVVLKSIVAADDEAFKEVQKEIHYMKQFSGHKNIVTYIDSECFPSKFGTNHKAFILMEYCPGGHVVDIMNRRLNDRLTETEILRIFSDTCEAVALFHYSKPPILHRDIKVENVLLSASGSFKLCDYGSATTNIFQPNIVLPSREIYKLEEDIQKHTTLQYRAPELCDLYQRKGMTEKVDIWALGVMLYKLCYYTTPFEEGGQLAILNARYTIPPTPVFSQKLLALIGAMLQDDPRKRPNIYQLLLNVSNMRKVPCPIQNIYEDTIVAQQSPVASPRIANNSIPTHMSSPVTPQQNSVASPTHPPMRRGRPQKKTNAEQDPFGFMSGQPASVSTSSFGFEDSFAPSSGSSSGKPSGFADFSQAFPSSFAPANNPSPVVQQSFASDFVATTTTQPSSNSQMDVFSMSPHASPNHSRHSSFSTVAQVQADSLSFPSHSRSSSMSSPKRPPFNPTPILSQSMQTSSRHSSFSATAASLVDLDPPRSRSTSIRSSQGSFSSYCSPSIPSSSHPVLNSNATPLASSLSISSSLGTSSSSSSPNIVPSAMTHRKTSSAGDMFLEDLKSLSVNSVPNLHSGSPPSTKSSPNAFIRGSFTTQNSRNSIKVHNGSHRLKWLAKLTTNQSVGFKNKYMNRLILEIWRASIFNEPTTAWVFDYLRKLPTNDPFFSLKSLYIVHRMIIECPPETLGEIHSRSMVLDGLKQQWKGKNTANSNLIVIYADFLIDILKFLTSHPGFEGSFSLDVAMQFSIVRMEKIASMTLVQDLIQLLKYAEEFVPFLSGLVNLTGPEDVRFWIMISLIEQVMSTFHAMLFVIHWLKQLPGNQGTIHVLKGSTRRIPDILSRFIKTCQSLISGSSTSYIFPSVPSTLNFESIPTPPPTVIPKIIRKLSSRGIDLTNCKYTKITDSDAMSGNPSGQAIWRWRGDEVDSSDSE